MSEGCVTGVIDFSDVSFGEPDYDFSSLFIDVGETFTIDVARRRPGNACDDVSTKEYVRLRLREHPAIGRFFEVSYGTHQCRRIIWLVQNG